MFFQLVCATIQERLTMIDRTVSVKRIITRLCPSFLQSPTCVLLTKSVAFINIYFDLVCLFNDIYSLRNQAGTDIFYICAFSLMIFQLMCTTTPKILSMTDCTISLKTLIKNYLS